MNLRSLFKPEERALWDAPEEHRISMPGIDVSFNHETKTVFIIDQTGAKDTQAFVELEGWYRSKGWFLHCVLVQPPPSEDNKE